MTKTLGAGAVWDIAFSTDPDQTFAYVADGMNEKVHVLRRKPLEYIYSFGSGGRMAGQFYGNHSIAVDSMGNVYTTETYEGKRVQRFVYKGMGNAQGDIGVNRPTGFGAGGGVGVGAGRFVDLLVRSQPAEATVVLSRYSNDRTRNSTSNTAFFANVTRGLWKYSVTKPGYKGVTGEIHLYKVDSLNCTLIGTQDSGDSFCNN